METQATRRSISKGICTFCKTEPAKNKMTQHLKSCKQRLATIAMQEEKSQETKTRLFHILAEGQYNPQYWLHFEMPASEDLWALDNFLKKMWVDDLDHLSGFTINGTNYREYYENNLTSFKGRREREEKKIRKLVNTLISPFTEEFCSSVNLPFQLDPLPAEWIAEIKKPRSVDELVDFLKGELARITKEDKSVWTDNQESSPEAQYKKYRTLYDQKMLVRGLLDAVEDRSFRVLLARVLNVGQKFSYIYDFGTSTYINLRVIAEREGIIQNKKEPVQLLAQNTAPTFPCTVCGKPGTTVAVDYSTDTIEESVYCTECAEKRTQKGRTLSISNSPRAGVL